MNDTHANGFYVPIKLVQQLISNLSDPLADVTKGATYSEKTIKLQTHQKIVVRMTAAGRAASCLELYHQVPQDIKQLT